MKTLTLDQLLSEVEVLGFDVTTKIKGGKDDVIELPEVVVTDTYSPSYDNFYYFMPSYYGGDGGYGGAEGGGGYGGGGGGGGSSSSNTSNSQNNNDIAYHINLPEATIIVTNYSANDAISVMLSSMGLSATFADVSSVIAKIESTSGFSLASRAFGFLDIGTNLYDFYQTGDIEDLGQAALGLVLITPGLNGGIVIAGSIALLAWEIAEMVQDNQQGIAVPNLN